MYHKGRMHLKLCARKVTYLNNILARWGLISNSLKIHVSIIGLSDPRCCMHLYKKAFKEFGIVECNCPKVMTVKIIPRALMYQSVIPNLAQKWYMKHITFLIRLGHLYIPLQIPHWDINLHTLEMEGSHVGIRHKRWSFTPSWARVEDQEENML